MSKGKSAAIGSTASISPGDGDVELDRADYGSHYGSGKLFRFLGKHVSNDQIDLHVKIHTEKPRL